MDKLFTELPVGTTGVDFKNKVYESEKLHYYKYVNLYSGGGVAAADFNNDGFQDLFFISNIYPNKLFLNKGNFKFDDITEKAGLDKIIGFDTGVSVADVNNDGYLDIYINRAGWYEGDVKLANILYVNNGDLTFSERAKEFGIADTNRSITSTFFDYDNDGDLDLYVVNTPLNRGISNKIFNLKQISTSSRTAQYKSSDQLYRNEGGKFKNVSIDAGILPDLGFGLNAQVGDLNNDGWLDIYVSNDFVGPDFAYINNGDGTFTDKRNEYFKHMSHFSMGSDIADINNDGHSDIVVADMSSNDYVRSKTTMAMMPIERFVTMTENNYHHQYMHNVLQLNNGNSTFSEIAQFSGVAQTDWSWATLLADFDLDGFNDLFVTNGMYRDVQHRDINREIRKYLDANLDSLQEKDFFELTQKLPQEKLTNFFFKNNKDLTFSDSSEDWADLKGTFSNGAVYVDLDNDGDLDVVTNNLDENATILRNNSRELNKGDYLQMTFKGPKSNPFGVGAKAEIYLSNGEYITRQLVNSRGYLSSLPNRLHFGLGKGQKIDSLVVTWLGGKEQRYVDIEPNQSLTVNYNDIQPLKVGTEVVQKTIFQEESFDFVHKEKAYNDFEKQLLLPHKLSQTGPAVAKADLNNDGVDDLYLGGANDEIGQLLISKNGTYERIDVSVFENDKLHEDVAACFFDSDGDGDKDLYVVSGSYEFDEESELLLDRLYINKGNFRFVKSNSSLPKIKSSGSTVIASDYDKDGDQDLFIGGRVIPGRYPYAPKSTLLVNNGGVFTNKTSDLAEGLGNIGMVTTANWADIDNDNDVDLVVAGEWMGIEVFVNDQGHLAQGEIYEQLASQKGWWNKIMLEDLDGDGDLDIVAGNLGLNYKFRASEKKPFHIYTTDFDDNGVEDIVLAKEYKSEMVPVRGKSCTAQQMPYLEDRVKTYQEFATSNVREIFGADLDNALHLEAKEFRSGYFKNNGNGSFEFVPFPNVVQLSPINSIIYNDFDDDGIKDLLLAGNNYTSEVETTRADAGIGCFLKGRTNLTFQYVSHDRTGLFANNDVREMVLLNNKGKDAVLVANNNDRHQLYQTIN